MVAMDYIDTNDSRVHSTKKVTCKMRYTNELPTSHPTYTGKRERGCIPIISLNLRLLNGAYLHC